VSTYPAWPAGDLVTAGKLRDGQWQLVVKQTTETTTATSVQDDDELVVPLAASATYFGIFGLALGATSSVDIQTQYSVPAGASGFKFCLGPAQSSTDRTNTTMASAVHNFTTTRVYGATSTSSVPAMIEHWVCTTTSAGNLVYRWASNAAGTSVNLGGAWVAYQRVA
jgi:hypothetical protein